MKRGSSGRFFALSLLFAAMGLSCQKGEKKTSSEGVVAEESISLSTVAGTYQAKMPGANSMMEIELILKEDQTFQRTTRYVDKFDEAFTEQGTFRVRDSLIVLNLDSTRFITKYKIGKGFLQQLDMDGEIINGALSDTYKFKKVGGR